MFYRRKAHTRLTDETYLYQLTLSERKSSPKCGELRECGEGMSSTCKSKMTLTIRGQGSLPGTYETDCQNVPVTDKEIGKQVLSLGNTAIAVRGQNRFEESIIPPFPIKVPGCQRTDWPRSGETEKPPLKGGLRAAVGGRLMYSCTTYARHK